MKEARCISPFIHRAGDQRVDVRADNLVQGEDLTISDYTTLGNVDPHPEAVAYAKKTGAQVIVLPTAEEARESAQTSAALKAAAKASRNKG